MANLRKTLKYTSLLIAWLITIWLINATAQANEEPTTYPFRIVQISDTQPNLDSKEQLQHVSESIALVNKLNPDIVIVPGDITSTGTENEFRQLKKMFSAIKAPTYYLPGNHDTITPANETEAKLPHDKLRENKLPLYQKYFGPDHWSFERGNFLFVGFDSTENQPNLSPETRQWLKETLQKSEKPYKFLVTHYTQKMISESSLDELLAQARVTGMLHGHNHTVQAYKDTKSGRLAFSSGSSNLMPPEKYGVMYFDIYETSMVCFWQPVNGPTEALAAFDLNKISAAIEAKAVNQQKATAPNAAK